RDVAGRKSKSAERHSSASATGCCARPVSRLSRRAGRQGEFTGGNLCGAQTRDQLLALEGSAFLHPRRQVPPSDGHGSPCQAATTPGGLLGASASSQLLSFPSDTKFNDRDRRFGQESGRSD